MFKRKSMLKGFDGFQATKIVCNKGCATCSLWLRPMDVVLCPDHKSKGHTACCNGRSQSRANNQELKKGSSLDFMLIVFMIQSIRFSVLCIHLHGIIHMTTVIKER